MGKPQDNHSHAKHSYEVGSNSERMGGISNPNPHNQLQVSMGYNSGEIMSPRSVLEKKALSGLAIAIALEESKKPWARPLITAREDLTMERLYSKESINRMINTKNEEGVATKEEVVDGDQANLISTSNMSASSSISSRNLVNCRSLPENRHNDWLNHEHGLYEEASFPSSNSLGESIFYCANPSPNNSNYTATNDNQTCFAHPTMEDILKFCFFCKCHLGVGKDIYMYRGDRAFCSAECRYQHIVNDECKGSSSSTT